MERSRTRSPLIEGVLLLDKPAGFTSHDAITRARRVLGVRRIGHMGTLDPFATGLLVLLVGRITRLAPYIEGDPKVYEATIRFGAETSTDDLTGAVTATAPLPSRDAVEAAIPSLTGVIDQQPPAYSAKKVNGVRAYDAARRGIPLELADSTVMVHRWEIRGWRDESALDVSIVCGGGTYIRSLARDLGRLAGSAAHLGSLRRARSGPFSVSDAVALDSLAPDVTLRSALEGLAGIPALAVTPAERARIARGQSIDAAGADTPDASCRRAVLIGGDREILALAERRESSWAPKVVLIDA